MTDEESHGLFRRKVVEAGGFWQIAWLFFTQGFQMARPRLIRMGISQSCDLAPELLNVVTSLIPTSHDIGLVRIKTTSMLMVVVRFHILSLREPPSSPARGAPSPVGSAHIARLGALSKGVHQRSQRRVQTLLPASGSTGSALFGSLCSSARQCTHAFWTASVRFL